MLGVFSWIDVDVLFTFNFDLDLKLSLSQVKYLYFFDIVPLMGTTLYSMYLIELNLYNGRSLTGML